MVLENSMMDDFREFMRYRQEYLKQVHQSAATTPTDKPDKTIEPQPSSPQPEVPASQESQGSGFHVVPLPNDLQTNLVKCVRDDSMKVLTPETVFIQHAIREIIVVKTMLDQLINKVASAVQDSNSTRSPLLPVAHQDDHAFRPIEVQEQEQETAKPVQNRRRATKKKRDAGNRRATKNRKS